MKIRSCFVLNSSSSSFVLDAASIPFKELSELLQTGSPESVLTESNRGNVVIVDHEKDSIASQRTDCET